MGSQSAPTADTGERRYSFFSALGGGVNASWRWFITTAPLDLELGRRWIDRFRALGYLATGDFYPLLPHTLSEGRWLAAQYDRSDLGEGMAIAFRRRYAAATSTILQLHGLEPSATYRLTFQSSGAVTAQLGRTLAEGLAVTLPEAPAYEIVHYQLERAN